MLVGIVGGKGVGKDTVADYLVQKYGFSKDSFAENLKRACRELFQLSDDQLYNEAFKELPDPRLNGVTPRKIFQKFGTEILRNLGDQIIPGIGKDIHIRGLELRLAGKLGRNNPAGHKVVLADVRMFNEAEMVRRNGGILIKIVRPENTLYSANDTHQSEVEWTKIECDYIIINDTTKAELFANIDKCLEEDEPFKKASAEKASPKQNTNEPFKNEPFKKAFAENKNESFKKASAEKSNTNNHWDVDKMI